MATVICHRSDCKHRSKRKLKKWQMKDGTPCYGCSLGFVNIIRMPDLDGDIRDISGEENMSICINYEN